MKIVLVTIILYSISTVAFFGDTKSQVTIIKTDSIPLSKMIIEHRLDSITDERDGEVYATIKIGKQTWFAENLRYKTDGSIINPDNPSKSYGRLYEINTVQTACPKGWHLPTDKEWDELEIAHGMPVSFIGKGGWRGEHAVNLKSTDNWKKNGNGTNKLGFNVLPAGYYFSEKMGELAGLEGLGFSAAFWSAIRFDAVLGFEVGYARFMFSSRLFVNKWEDINNESEASLSCRCVKDN